MNWLCIIKGGPQARGQAKRNKFKNWEGEREREREREREKKKKYIYIYVWYILKKKLFVCVCVVVKKHLRWKELYLFNFYLITAPPQKRKKKHDLFGKRPFPERALLIFLIFFSLLYFFCGGEGPGDWFYGKWRQLTFKLTKPPPPSHLLME